MPTQTEVLAGFKVYLEYRERQGAKPEWLAYHAPKVSAAGHCGGFASLWACANMQGDAVANIDNFPLFEKVLDILGNLEWCIGDDKEAVDEEIRDYVEGHEQDIERMMAQILFLQDPTPYVPHAQGQLDKLIELLVQGKKDSIKPRQEYALAGSFVVRDLADILPQIIKEKCMIVIVSHDHATALVRRGDECRYYDPNYAEGYYTEYQLAKTDDMESLAEEIFKCNSLDESDDDWEEKPAIIGITVFGFAEDINVVHQYPAQRELLEIYDRYDPNEVLLEYQQGFTPLHMAARTGCVESMAFYRSKYPDLLSRLAKGGCTPFDMAVFAGNARIVRELPHTEADLRVNMWSQTLRGNMAAANTLLQLGIPVDAPLFFGETALFAAVANEQHNLVDFLLAQGASIPLAIFIAAKEGNVKVIEYFLNRGSAWVNDNDGSGHPPLLTAISHGKLEVAELLLEWEANVDTVDEQGNSALLLAVKNRHDIGGVLLLLEHYADPNLANRDGLTPLVVAGNKGKVNQFQALLCYRYDEELEIDKSQLEEISANKKIMRSIRDMASAANYFYEAIENDGSYVNRFFPPTNSAQLFASAFETSPEVFQKLMQNDFTLVMREKPEALLGFYKQQQCRKLDTEKWRFLELNERQLDDLNARAGENQALLALVEIYARISAEVRHGSSSLIATATLVANTTTVSTMPLSL